MDLANNLKRNRSVKKRNVLTQTCKVDKFGRSSILRKYMLLIYMVETTEQANERKKKERERIG